MSEDFIMADLLTNITYYMDLVENKSGAEPVLFVLKKYGASNLEELNARYYQDVFNELHTLITDN